MIKGRPTPPTQAHSREVVGVPNFWREFQLSPEENLLVIQELSRQQKMMHDTRSHRAEDRIVSISQPQIVRGKAKANVEFGAKVAVSMVDGYARVGNAEGNGRWTGRNRTA